MNNLASHLGQPAPRSPAIRFSKFLPSAILALLLTAELSLLAARDYSTSWLELAPMAEPSEPLVLGKLRWDPRDYVGRPELAAFATLVEEQCPGKGPLETARCLSSLLATRFVHGQPVKEFFSLDFSPAESLKEHLAGAIGHCVTRSGIIATALLVSGVPARVVQLKGTEEAAIGGHNALEVYEPGRGWLLFDPSYGGEVVDQERPQSAIQLLESGKAVLWSQSSKVPAMGSEVLDGNSVYNVDAGPKLLRYLAYPEPWLYTRIGSRTAPIPFRGRFALVGPQARQLVTIQWALHTAIGLTAAGMVVTLLRSLSRRRLAAARRRRQSEEMPAPMRATLG